MKKYYVSAKIFQRLMFIENSRKFATFRQILPYSRLKITMNLLKSLGDSYFIENSRNFDIFRQIWDEKWFCICQNPSEINFYLK